MGSVSVALRSLLWHCGRKVPVWLTKAMVVGPAGAFQRRVFSTFDRLCHFATVFGLMPSSRLRSASKVCNRWSSAPTARPRQRARGTAVTYLSHRAFSDPPDGLHLQTAGSNIALSPAGSRPCGVLSDRSWRSSLSSARYTRRPIPPSSARRRRCPSIVSSDCRASLQARIPSGHLASATHCDRRRGCRSARGDHRHAR